MNKSFDKENSFDNSNKTINYYSVIDDNTIHVQRMPKEIYFDLGLPPELTFGNELYDETKYTNFLYNFMTNKSTENKSKKIDEEIKK